MDFGKGKQQCIFSYRGIYDIIAAGQLLYHLRLRREISTAGNGRGKHGAYRTGRPLPSDQKEAFVEQAYEEPCRRVIKADQSFIVESAPAVIPRAGMMLFQERSGCIFGQIDHAGIDASADNGGQAAQLSANRSEQRRHSVDREHPYGGAAG